MKYKTLLYIIVFCFLLSCKKHPFFSGKDLSSVKVVDHKFVSHEIPKKGFIIIKKGETIYTISNKYQIIPKDIIDANKLKEPYTLHKDQKIILPYPLIHIVKKDDTIYSLSIQYAVNQSDIVELNSLTKPFELSKLKKIKIPLNKDYSVIGLDQKPKPYQKKLSTNSSSSIKLPTFIWPMNGKVIKRFGSYSNGKQHNDGIDIEVNKSKEIKAAFDGKVAFVGSNIKSFGNMILIKHDNKWVSAYSKLGVSLVSEGQNVKKGDVIASMKENKVLHFQIRKSRNPIDPEKLLN